MVLILFRNRSSHLVSLNVCKSFWFDPPSLYTNQKHTLVSTSLLRNVVFRVHDLHLIKNQRLDFLNVKATS